MIKTGNENADIEYGTCPLDVVVAFPTSMNELVVYGVVQRSVMRC